MPEVDFKPLPWPPSETCACGSPAAWEMWFGTQRIPLCSECYQIESARRSSQHNDLLDDRIHRTWLLYPWDKIAPL